ncbi:bifunctional [glutamine synthetase] adenylyltransferase/[glutamine synthetase]-adenylyl-L-tyrosine phosphorylase [Corynebacterium sp. 35RC1]|nr:bifunctional [glutamine synthetase] adenylyltransferase/[glutamine synthetase]-adenylyl-L-tyrosine phosphorylase [Corynebacterium sp. 35RC1]
MSNHSNSARTTLPTIGALGLNGMHAHQDLEWLGWWNTESIDLLWGLTGVGDPDLALNTLIRLMQTVDDAERAELDAQLRSDLTFRVRLFSLLGGSATLGDHLVANPHLWREISKPIPTRADMFKELLSAIEAEPAGEVVPEGEAEGEGVGAQEPDPDPNPDPASADLRSHGTYRAGPSRSGAEAEQVLRKTYRNLLLRIAAVDLAGTYLDDPRRQGQPAVGFRVVTNALADLADAALTSALAVAVRTVYGDAPIDSRLAVIAMGKCGARELNYISDVDVIFVAEPVTARGTRLAGEFIRIGCNAFFEVDAALRPEGKHGALTRTLESHVTYYKRWADTWEFQALLKARPMTGYMPLGQAYHQAIGPMVWEASQRESFVDDVQAMRRRVLDNVPEKLKIRELKLGEGGLRDVEFAVQLLQLVHGRSDETLRVLATVDALEALVAGGYVGREDGSELVRAYEFLRLLEHRLQLQKVKRTHTLPQESDAKNLRWLARASGMKSSKLASSEQALDDTLRKVRLQISSLHRKLFYRPLLNSVVNFDAGTINLSPEAAKLQLKALRYRFPDRAFEHLKALAAGSGRKAKIQALLLPILMEWLANTADPDAGLLNYRKLSEAAEDRTWFLRMLRDEGIVAQRLMTILGNSPYAADLFISTPDVVKLLGDGATGPKLLERSSDTITKSLVAAAGRQNDPTKAINVARSLRRNELARVAAADLLSLMGTREVCESLSNVWNAVLEAAIRAEVKASLKELGVDKPLARIAVIGMGRLGGAELGYGSDADVMFVCDPAEGVAENDAVKWAISVCEGLRTRLATPSGDPPLEVDLGLRPEGRSGAAVRTLESYKQYYERWGEIWEIQALLRATDVAGDRDLGVRFLKMIDTFRYPAQGTSAATIKEVRRMKARVDNERLPRGADRNTHTKLGRGALTDIEWTVQLLTLEHAHEYPQLQNTSTLEVLEAIGEAGILSATQVDILTEAWLTATEARNSIVLVRGKRVDQLPQPGPQLAAVAGAAGWDPNQSQEFLDHYLKVTRRARKVVDQVFWGEEVSPHEY